MTTPLPARTPTVADLRRALADATGGDRGRYHPVDTPDGTWHVVADTDAGPVPIASLGADEQDFRNAAALALALTLAPLLLAAAARAETAAADAADDAARARAAVDAAARLLDGARGGGDPAGWFAAVADRTGVLAAAGAVR